VCLHLEALLTRQRLNVSRKIITLKERMNPAEYFRCPVRMFLALALADDVFVEQNKPEDFEVRFIPPTANSRSFSIKETKKRLPIFRTFDRDRMSETKMLSATSASKILSDICKDCGYTEPVTAYTFRRGVANKLEGNHHTR
jgi:integrase